MSSERWPGLMLRETAAAYCDMTPDQFDRQCPVAPVDQGWRGLRWKRSQLDRWIENLPEKPRRRAAAIDDQAAGPSHTPEPPITADERRKAALERL